MRVCEQCHKHGFKGQNCSYNPATRDFIVCVWRAAVEVDKEIGMEGWRDIERQAVKKVEKKKRQAQVTFERAEDG